MVMKKHGNVRGEVRVNFLALFASKPHIFMCGALKSSGIVRANVRLNIAIAMFFLSLKFLQRIFPQIFRLCFSRASGPPKSSRPKFTSKIVGTPLQFHIFEPKMLSRRFSAYGGDFGICASPPQKHVEHRN